jgi:hypothetical protein
LKDRYGILRSQRYSKRPVVSLFTIQQDLVKSGGSVSILSGDSATKFQDPRGDSETTARVETKVEEVGEEETPLTYNYERVITQYDPTQDIGIQNYLTSLTRTEGKIDLVPIYVPEKPATLDEKVRIPIVPVVSFLVEMGSRIAFAITDTVPPPNFLAPIHKLMTPSQIQGELVRIGRLELLLDKVLDEVALTDPAKSGETQRVAVIQGTRKAFIRWFFNANSDGNIVGMYPRNADALNKYSTITTERYPYTFTQEMLDAIPNPKPEDVSLEKVRKKVDRRTGLGNVVVRTNYQDRYDITEEMLYMYAYRYASMNVPTMSLAVSPEQIKRWRIEIELFGSLFNTVKPYAGAFSDEPLCLGNFFDLSFEAGRTYLANPPYDETLMERMAKRLVEVLGEVETLTIYVVIPVWDPEGRKKLNLKPGGKFKAYDLLLKSPYVKASEVRRNMQFYDYFTQSMVRPTPVRVMVLSNQDLELQSLSETAGLREEGTARSIFLRNYPSRKEAINDLVNKVISGEIPFPYSTTFRMSAADQLYNFRAYNPNIGHEEYKVLYHTPHNLFTPNYFRSYEPGSPYTNVISQTSNWNTIDSFADMFTESERIKTTKGSKSSSIAEDWRNPRKVRKIVEILLSDPKLADMSHTNWRNAITYSTKEPTNFKMTWVKGLFYSVFGLDAPWESMRWLDISAGWGDRLGAALGLGMGYLGFDPNTGLKEGHTQMISQFGTPGKQKVIYAPFETYELGPIVQAEGAFDVVFTSPPFFLQELYPGEQQSTDQYTTYEQWMTGFLFRSLKNAWDALKTGGYLMIHMGDSWYQGERKPTNEAMNLYIEQHLEGSSWEGVIGLQGNMPPSMPVWVWKKAGAGSDLVPREWAPGMEKRKLETLFPKLAM